MRRLYGKKSEISLQVEFKGLAPAQRFVNRTLTVNGLAGIKKLDRDEEKGRGLRSMNADGSGP